MGEDIRVVLAEDSPTVRHYLASIIHAAPDMKVVGEARNGQEAVQMVEDLRPDVVSMDINMPEFDGLEATRIIMENTPTPIVVVSELLEVDVQLSLQAIEAGALAVVNKPPHQLNPAFDEQQRQLLKTLRAMAGVKVISRRKPHINKSLKSDESNVNGSQSVAKFSRPELIVIGASTGGPGAILHFLRDMEHSISVPIVIVQHMPDEFINGLSQWLSSVTKLNVILAFDNMLIEKGMIILAPGDKNLTIERRDGLLVTKLGGKEEQSRYLPSVDVLFKSVASTVGKRTIGIILTGMGDDGAQGLLAIREAEGYTIVQDEASCAVFGMPRAAIDAGAVEKVLSLTNLASKIKKLL